MSILHGCRDLPAKLVHHTGSMIRFTTAQLPCLPTADVDCEIVLPDGKPVAGRFHLHPANPYIGGGALVRWIKTWVEWNRPVDVVVEQVGRGNQLQLRMPGARPTATPEQTRTRRKALRYASIESVARRRSEYSTWERDPALRRVALQAWPAKCQVRGCDFGSTLPDALRPAIVQLHHVVFVSTGGSDSPLNVCLLCANHHTLIHHAPGSRIQHCNAKGVRVEVDGVTLDIERNVADLWRLIDV